MNIDAINLPGVPENSQAASAQPDLTILLNEWRAGNDAAFGQLIDQVYGELKRIAVGKINRLGGVVTLSPTDLLHEALIGIMPSKMDFKNRTHFYATMSLAIRSILVDHARARATDKRGGGIVKITLTDAEVGESSPVFELLAIDQALLALEKMDARCAQVMHLTYFAGLSREEIGEMLNITIRTVGRDLLFGRAWLAKALANDT